MGIRGSGAAARRRRGRRRVGWRRSNGDAGRVARPTVEDHVRNQKRGYAIDTKRTISEVRTVEAPELMD